MTAEPNALLLSVLPFVRLLAGRAAAGLRMGADDVFQTLALAVLTAAPKHDPGRGKFTTFAAAVCRRAVGDLIEAQARQVAASRFPAAADGGELLPADPRQPDPAEQAADAEAWLLVRRRVHSALSRLTPLERRAVAARFGFGGREPARALKDIDPSRSASASQQTLARAMAKLEDALRRPPKTTRRLKRLRRLRERRAAAVSSPKCPVTVGLPAHRC